VRKPKAAFRKGAVGDGVIRLWQPPFAFGQKDFPLGNQGEDEPLDVSGGRRVQSGRHKGETLGRQSAAPESQEEAESWAPAPDDRQADQVFRLEATESGPEGSSAKEGESRPSSGEPQGQCQPAPQGPRSAPESSGTQETATQSGSVGHSGSRQSKEECSEEETQKEDRTSGQSSSAAS
jgi:hypothetical protein